jgi:hypothetical protein
MWAKYFPSSPACSSMRRKKGSGLSRSPSASVSARALLARLRAFRWRRVFTLPASATFTRGEEKCRRALARPSASAPVTRWSECYLTQQELRFSYLTRSMRWSFSGFTSRLLPESTRYRSTSLEYIANTFLARPKFALIHHAACLLDGPEHNTAMRVSDVARHIVVRRRISTALHEFQGGIPIYV